MNWQYINCTLISSYGDCISQLMVTPTLFHYCANFHYAICNDLISWPMVPNFLASSKNISLVSVTSLWFYLWFYFILLLSVLLWCSVYNAAMSIRNDVNTSVTCAVVLWCEPSCSDDPVNTVQSRHAHHTVSLLAANQRHNNRITLLHDKRTYDKIIQCA